MEDLTQTNLNIYIGLERISSYMLHTLIKSNIHTSYADTSHTISGISMWSFPFGNNIGWLLYYNIYNIAMV